MDGWLRERRVLRPAGGSEITLLVGVQATSAAHGIILRGRWACVTGSGALGLPPLGSLPQATDPIDGPGKAAGGSLAMGCMGGHSGWREGGVTVPSPRLRAGTWAETACFETA